MLITFQNFQNWCDPVEALHDKMIDLGEIESGMSIQEEKMIDSSYYICWDLYLELFVRSFSAPQESRYWVEVENSSSEIEIIEVFNGQILYKAPSFLCSGAEIQKTLSEITGSLKTLSL
jgi:hypothetical protein